MNKITRFYVGLYDEDMNKQIVNPEEVIRFCKNHFTGFTVFVASGGWMGESENTLVIEVVDLRDSITDDALDSMVKDSDKSAALEVKETLEIEFEQESVMTAELMGDVHF